MPGRQVGKNYFDGFGVGLAKLVMVVWLTQVFSCHCPLPYLKLLHFGCCLQIPSCTTRILSDVSYANVSTAAMLCIVQGPRHHQTNQHCKLNMQLDFNGLLLTESTAKQACTILGKILKIFQLRIDITILCHDFFLTKCNVYCTHEP